jgi:hypothetical protein
VRTHRAPLWTTGSAGGLTAVVCCVCRALAMKYRLLSSALGDGDEEKAEVTARGVKKEEGTVKMTDG